MRRYDLDNIRWVSVILVVLYHVIYIFNGIIPEGVVGPFHPVQPQDAFQYLVYPWFMILLFVVSGAAARLALERQTPKAFLAARTRKLLVPSTLGLFAFHWITGFVNMQISHAFDYMPADLPLPILYSIMAVSGTSVLWFIQLLWIYSVLLLLILKWRSGTEKLYTLAGTVDLPVLLLLMVPLWLSAQVLNTPVIPVYRCGIYGLSFLLGYFVFSQERTAEHLSRYWLPLTLAAVVLGLAYTLYYWGDNYAVAPVVNSFASIGYGWVTVLAVFALFHKFGHRTGPICHWMGRHSFGLYVFHYLPLSAAALWICRGHQLPPLPSYLITALAAFLGSWILEGVISRIPVLRFCVLGIRTQKEENHVS